MRRKIRPAGLALVVIVATLALPGCTSTATRVKSPIELMHGLAFGDRSLTKTEYRGSERAREWAMNEHAESMRRQAAEFAERQATAPGKTQL